MVSLYRYPLLPQLGLETVVNYLLEAPRITREAAGMSWTFLDAPQDGTVILVWQPLTQMGTNAASDGYLWADPEQAFSSEAKGYVRLCVFISEGDSLILSLVDCGNVCSQKWLSSPARTGSYAL